jgi:hypothetical protein
MDTNLDRVPELHGSKAFDYITKYLELLHEVSIASLLRVPLRDYSFLRKQLPSAKQYGNGKWQIHFMHNDKYDVIHCKRAISCLVDLSIRMDSEL